MSRRKTWGCSLVTGLVVATGFLVARGREGASEPPIADVLRARSFEVVDETGNVVAHIRAEGPGAAEIRLGNAASQVSLRVKDDTAWMYLQGETATINLSRESSQMFLRNSGMSLHARQPLTAREERMYRDSPDDETLLNKKFLGRPCVSFGLSDGENSTGFVSVFNPFGQEVVNIQSNKGNVGAIYLGDVNGKVSNSLTALR